MATVLLLGELGKQYGRKHNFDVRNPAEAIRALVANFPGFDRHLVESEERNVGYRVTVGKESIGEDALHNPSGKSVIKIAPVIMGSGSVGRIIIGAALIVAAIYYPPLAATTLFGTTTLATVAFNVGLALALGGVAQMLAPQPKSPEPSERPENKPSYSFNGAVNTTAQGQPVPVGYGRLIVGSAVISAGISTENI